MNPDLQRIFTLYYSPIIQAGQDRGASSWDYTRKMRDEFPDFVNRHGIRSMFDAGCNDCSWSFKLAELVDYQGGDISLAMVAHAWSTKPWLDVKVHDVTSDPIPCVDLLWVRDVAIHLNNRDKHRMLANWYQSRVPWIMLTQIPEAEHNIDFDYADGFPWAAVNWQQSPWCFPDPVDYIREQPEGERRMALWHRDQFREQSWQ
jgi:SAM-dependent methyltransferase